MPAGFLAVASQPSSQLPSEEYHAWYEEEHIPLRLNRLSSFLSGARYYAIDMDVGENEEVIRPRPGWLAMYEIDDTGTFEAEEYTGLRLRRSEREKGVMGRLEVLTRKTGEDLGAWGAPEGTDEGKTTGLKVGRPSEWVVTHGLEVTGKEYRSEETKSDVNQKAKDWAEEVATTLKAAQNGWIRTRLVKVLESGKTKMGVNVKQEEEEGMQYFVVHGTNSEFDISNDDKIQRVFLPEFSEEATATSQETKRMVFRLEPGKTGDWRVWKLYKAYPCVAQGNI